ncbi:hypothetical protein [uncultured Roseobacter sp.]|uniref:hypothetical protein n=1 Tax=uncultured Roseobacter sp. TaxID=114847 RepID=UPI00260A8CC0|nr:hypothetical protein [uncultured Roseobacter sp.]
MARKPTSANLRDIEIALYIGAPHTDDGQLTWSLRKDAQALLEQGVMIRRPGTYNKAVAQLLGKQAEGSISDEDRDNLLASIVKERPVSRLILANSSYLGVPAWMLNGGRFYKNAGRNTAELKSLFPDNKCVFFLALRNPATLIPAVFEAQSQKSWDAFLSGSNLLSLRWSDVISDIRTHNPDCEVVVWCNEDTPVIWPNVLGKVSGLGSSFRFKGELDIIRRAMSEIGFKRLESYLAQRPELSDMQRAQVRSLFLHYFHSEEVVEEEIDLPQWSQETVDEISEGYAEDIDMIKKIPGVTLLS